MNEIVQPASEPVVGSIVVNTYVQRSVTVLAIHEHEVDTISFLNGLSAACFSVASALVSFAVATWVNVAFQENLTPAAELLSAVVSPGALLLAAGFGIAGSVALSKRKSTLTTIKSQGIVSQELA